MSMTTPSEITDQIRQFCNELVPGLNPTWVRFDPRNAGAIDECYENVATVVERSGGQLVLGWTIWEWPGVLLEAISHAAWEREDGELLDPTPKVDGEEITLFLPDRNAVDNGGVVLARHWPLANWPEIVDYIDVCRRIGEAQQEFHPLNGGVPVEVWGPLLNEKETIVASINQRQARETARTELTRDVAIHESEAANRFSASPADVEASTALARHHAARGEYRQAFEALMQTAGVSRQKAQEVRETFLQLFEACEDDEMVNDARRRYSMLLF